MSDLRNWKSFWDGTASSDTAGPDSLGQSHLVSAEPVAEALTNLAAAAEPTDVALPDLATGSACGCCAGGIHGGSGTSTDAAPPVLGTLSDLANQLTNGYWGGSSHKWGSSTITVNLSGLAIGGEVALARAAMAAWERVANVDFVEVSGSANINWTDGGNNSTYVAFASTSWNGAGVLQTGATINISQYWYNQNGGAGGTPGVFSSYGYQTYIHELGHAIGLGHQGDYNGSATYGVDNKFTNDSWQFSVMSYMNQNNFGGASYAYVSGPQMADILAAQNLYGAPVNSGTHYYGDNPSVAGAGYNFANGVQSFTMYSADGWVALDSSTYSGSQTINMNAGQYSSVRGLNNNISQYTSTTMTEYYGGSGSDFVTLNTNSVAGSNGNVVFGNNGADTFYAPNSTSSHSIYGGTGIDTYDTVSFPSSNLAAGSLVRTSQSNNGWAFKDIGPSSQYDYLFDVEKIHFTNGDVTLRQAKSNFNFTYAADIGATSDFVLSAGGYIGTWEVQNNSVHHGTTLSNSLPGWTVVGTGDVTGDGSADVLLQNGGSLVAWSMANGNISNGYTVALGLTGWKLVGTGDMNNDGTVDIVMQNLSSGAVVDFIMANGTVSVGKVIVGSSGGYNVVGVADYNGDGTSDIMVQNGNVVVDWIVSNGLYSSGNVLSSNTAGFRVVGSGDFDGDGDADVILQNGGSFVEWTLQNGAYVSGNVLAVGADGYSVVGTGDYNGDGVADVALQNGSALVIWAMQNGAYAYGSVVSTGLAGWTVIG